MGPNMKENGILIKIVEMVKVFKFGLMDQFTRDIGKTIKLTEEVDLSMQMETCMKENGKMTKPMVSGNIITMTVHIMRDTGRKTDNMAMVRKDGLMEHSMRVTIKMARKMVLESSYGLTGRHTQAHF